MNIDKRKKYILAFGAVLLIMAIAYRFSPDLDGIYPSENEVAELTDQLSSYRLQLKKLKGVKARTRRLEKELAEQRSNLFTADTPSLAAVEIQKIIDRIVSESSVEISSTQVLDARQIKAKPYMEVPIRITFAATIDKLKNILYEIEFASKYLKIIDAKCRSSARGGENRRISVNLTVAGLMSLQKS